MRSMLTKLRFFFPLLILSVIAIGGLSRVQLDKSLIAIFPQKNEKVQIMAEIKDHFENGGRLILQLDSEEADLQEEARSLTETLEETGLCAQILYQPLWEGDKTALTDLLAYFWFNGDPASLAQILQFQHPENVQLALSDAQEQLALTMDPAEISVLSRDPLGFIHHPELTKLREVNPFQNEDGTSQLLIVYPARSDSSSGDWFSKIHPIVKSWKHLRPDIQVHSVGAPVYAHEIATNVKSDVILTIIISSIFSGIIFWLLVRKNRLIHWQLAFITLILFFTFGIGSLILGKITLMSAGFASILIGLAVDYGMLICTEAKRAERCGKQLLASVKTSIIYASLTTAVVFSSLTLSQLPGVKELGVFVTTGILLSAFILLRYFTPIAARLAHLEPVKKQTPTSKKTPNLRPIQILLIVSSVIGIALMVNLGVPEIRFNLRAMSPADGEAEKSLKHLQATFPQSFAQKHSDTFIKGNTNKEILEAIKKLSSRPELAVSSPLPLQIVWPNADNQELNKKNISKLSEQQESILRSLDTAGFGGDALKFNTLFFEKLSNYYSTKSLAFTQHPLTKNYLDTFMRVHPDGSGSAIVQTLTQEEATLHSTSWEEIETDITEQLPRDLTVVILFVTVAVIIMLAIAIRNIYETCLGLICLFSPLMIILLIVHYSSLSWNFLNIFALPLLLGMGVDYVIHVIYAMRRNESSRHTSGLPIQKTLLACGLTTVVGFAALTASSNQAFVSMGLICGIGILLSMLYCIILLPAFLQGKNPYRG